MRREAFATLPREGSGLVEEITCAVKQAVIGKCRDAGFAATSSAA
jgi:hypothetical protein